MNKEEMLKYLQRIVDALLNSSDMQDSVSYQILLFDCLSDLACDCDKLADRDITKFENFIKTKKEEKI